MKKGKGKKMSKRKLYLAILFILGVSLLNVAVLINASNQESQLSIDVSDQRPVPVTRKKFVGNACGTYNKRCTINAPESVCYEVDGKC